jgi:hypothetical protein
VSFTCLKTSYDSDVASLLTNLLQRRAPLLQIRIMRLYGARRPAVKVSFFFFSFFFLATSNAFDSDIWSCALVFRVPTTHDFLTALFHPAYPKSHFDIINLGLLALQLVLFFYLPRSIAKPFFLIYFVFWRAAYDAGLGCVLTKQSKRKWIVREIQKRGWLDQERRPRVRNWIRDQLVEKMGRDYNFDVRADSGITISSIQ